MSDIPVHDDDCPFSSMRGKPILHSCSLKRVAELEAELAMERGAIKNRDEALSQSNAWWGVEYRKEKARAEKAEAEVERLTLSLLATEDMLLSSNRDDWAVALAKDRKKRVNPSGDQSLLSQKPRENGVSPSPPASFFCGICNVWFDEYVDLQNHAKHESAARKERDG